MQKGLPRAKPLGEILVELGLARPEDVEEALQKQRRGGGRLEDTLVQSGKLRPEALAQAVATQLGYPYVDPEEDPPIPAPPPPPRGPVPPLWGLPHRLEETASSS